jgi:hypothetical protein
MSSTVKTWVKPEAPLTDSDGNVWLDNPLEGDGIVHDKCGTPDCCGECEEEGGV